MKKSFTFAEVEEALVEAAALWARSPGAGLWPTGRGAFATDAPWNQLTRLVRAGSAMEARRIEEADEARPRAMPLGRAEVARRDAVSEWLRHAPEHDRRLVAMVADWKAKRTGESVGERVRYDVIRARLGLGDVTTDGLRMRYRRAISAIARALSV